MNQEKEQGKSFSKNKKIPVLDILGLGAFLFCHGNNPEWTLNGTRALLLFDANDRFYELSTRFNTNEAIPILDFLAAQRQLKAKMFAMKDRGSSNDK